MIVVYVMPLGTWLSGRFRGGGQMAFPGPKRTDEEVRRGLEALDDRLERILAFRPPRDESGPILSATVFSLDGFARPFELAQQWATRIKLPRLCSMEPPQIWLPSEFEPVIRIPAPWAPDSEVTVASSAEVRRELARLIAAILKEERPELDEAERVANRLLESADLGVSRGLPVIVEI